MRFHGEDIQVKVITFDIHKSKFTLKTNENNKAFLSKLKMFAKMYAVFFLNL